MIEKKQKPEGWMQVKDIPAFVKFCEAKGFEWETISNETLHDLAAEFHIYQTQNGEA